MAIEHLSVSRSSSSASTHGFAEFTQPPKKRRRQAPAVAAETSSAASAAVPGDHTAELIVAGRAGIELLLQIGRAHGFQHGQDGFHLEAPAAEGLAPVSLYLHPPHIDLDTRGVLSAVAKAQFHTNDDVPSGYVTRFSTTNPVIVTRYLLAKTWIHARSAQEIRLDDPRLISFLACVSIATSAEHPSLSAQCLVDGHVTSRPATLAAILKGHPISQGISREMSWQSANSLARRMQLDFEHSFLSPSSACLVEQSVPSASAAEHVAATGINMHPGECLLPTSPPMVIRTRPRWIYLDNPPSAIAAASSRVDTLTIKLVRKAAARQPVDGRLVYEPTDWEQSHYLRQFHMRAVPNGASLLRHVPGESLVGLRARYELRVPGNDNVRRE